MKMASDDEFLPEWFRSHQGRGPPFGWMDRWFSDIDQMFGQMFQDMVKGIPKENMTEKKLPDGSTIRQYGPFVYGYSMSMGPDGKPNIQEFGNVKPSKKPGAFGFQQPALEPMDTGTTSRRHQRITTNSSCSRASRRGKARHQNIDQRRRINR